MYITYDSYLCVFVQKKNTLMNVEDIGLHVPFFISYLCHGIFKIDKETKHYTLLHYYIECVTDGSIFSPS